MADPIVIHNEFPMSWTWNPVRITGVNAADPKPNPFVMDHTREPIFLPWQSKSKRKRKWLGVDASTHKNPHFVMDLIHDSSPRRLSEMSDRHEDRVEVRR